MKSSGPRYPAPGARPSKQHRQLAAQFIGRTAVTLLGPAFLAAIFLSACAVGPNYKRPPLEVPESFRGATNSAATNSLADLPWTGVFHDEPLQQLIRVALTNNYDVRIAITHVEQAQAILAQNRAAFFPQVNYNANISRGKNVVAGNAFNNNGNTTDYILAVGSASWELDLWGRVRRLKESGEAQVHASEEARRDVTISLIGQIAQAYFQLLALDQQLEIAHRTTNSFGESLTIFKERMEGGVASQLETSAAEGALDSAAATVPDLERQITVQENQINALLGRNPGPVPRSHGLLEQQPPPEVPAGLPSSLVERRPDIREAEQALRAYNAEVGVAVASFFPRISLTALFGQVSPELSGFTAGTANAWSLGATAVGPLFQGGLLSGQYHQILALRDEARLRYQATVLNAFEEVSDSLAAREKYAKQSIQQARAVQAYELAVKTSTDRYVAGRASYYEVLLEQQLLFPAENQLAQAQANQWLALVQLYRALGGGYQH